MKQAGPWDTTYAAQTGRKAMTKEKQEETNR